MAKSFASFVFGVLLIGVLVAGAWWIGPGLVPIAGAHWLDWITGAIALVWLVVILKAPWDLFFEARHVIFEMRRSREAGVAIAPAREAQVTRVARNLLALAIGAHVFSALLIAAIAWFSGGTVGYYFAAFYLLSTAFRPAATGYRHLMRWLRTVGQEIKYPREDVVLLKHTVDQHVIQLKSIEKQLEESRAQLLHETKLRETDSREAREGLHSLGREFERTMSRMTDNQEVIKGIQAFVRLISQSSKEH